MAELSQISAVMISAASCSQHEVEGGQVLSLMSSTPWYVAPSLSLLFRGSYGNRTSLNLFSTPTPLLPIRTFPKYQELLKFVVSQTGHNPILYFFPIQASIIPAFSSPSLGPNHSPKLHQWANWQSRGAGGFTKPGTANRMKAVERPGDCLGPGLQRRSWSLDGARYLIRRHLSFGCYVSRSMLVRTMFNVHVRALC